MKPLIAFALLTACTATLAASRVQLETPVTYAPNASVVASVRQECQIEDMLESRIGNALTPVNEGGDSTIGKGTKPADGVQLLRVRITHVLGVGGGAWSGPKAITVEAELIDQDKVVRRTQVHRTTTGGAFGGFKGTCSILERSAQAIGKDLARWVRDAAYKMPQPDANEAASAATPASQASAP